MRTVVFKIFLFFLLLGGGHYFYANAHQTVSHNASTQNFKENQRGKFSTKDQSITVIEDTDLDLEEEYTSTDHFKEKSNQQLFVGKYSANDKPTFPCLFVLDHYYKRSQNFEPFFGYTTPIYISNRVLRI